MEFFEGWKTLNARFDECDLTALTQLVGYKLLAIDNELRHPDSFLLTDRELMSRTNIKSGQTIVAARRDLKNAGLIDFKTAKSKPTRYWFTIKQDSSNNQANIKQDSSKNQASLASSNIRTREEVLDLKTEDSLSSSYACANTSKLDNILEYWEQSGGGRLTVEHQSELAALVEKRGADFVKAAIREAADSNGSRFGLSMKFFRSVLASKGGKKIERKRESRREYEEPDTSWIGGE